MAANSCKVRMFSVKLQRIPNKLDRWENKHHYSQPKIKNLGTQWHLCDSLPKINNWINIQANIQLKLQIPTPKCEKTPLKCKRIGEDDNPCPNPWNPSSSHHEQTSSSTKRLEKMNSTIIMHSQASKREKNPNPQPYAHRSGQNTLDSSSPASDRGRRRASAPLFSFSPSLSLFPCPKRPDLVLSRGWWVFIRDEGHMRHLMQKNLQNLRCTIDRGLRARSIVENTSEITFLGHLRSIVLKARSIVPKPGSIVPCWKCPVTQANVYKLPHYLPQPYWFLASYHTSVIEFPDF